jgi:hypothetical protein
LRVTFSELPFISAAAAVRIIDDDTEEEREEENPVIETLFIS